MESHKNVGKHCAQFGATLIFIHMLVELVETDRGCGGGGEWRAAMINDVRSD